MHVLKEQFQCIYHAAMQIILLYVCVVYAATRHFYSNGLKGHGHDFFFWSKIIFGVLIFTMLQ